MRGTGGEARKDVKQCNAVLSLSSLCHKLLQLQRSTADQLPGVFFQHTEFLQQAYKENHISEQFLVGKKRGVIYLPSILPSSIAHCSYFTLQKANSPVLPESNTQLLRGQARGVAFHPTWKLRCAWNTNQEKEGVAKGI